MIKSKILVVEDSVFFASVMKQRLEAELDVEVIFATTKKEAVEVIAQHKDDIFLSILDLTLPDAGGIEIVDTVTEFKVPIIVFTGTYSEDLRESILSRDVVDYVVKDNPSSLYYLVALVKRLFQNQNLTALIVDDSSTSRRYLCDLLKRYQFKTVEAADGIEALEVLDKNSSVRLIITDYHMPRMDGFELIKKVRAKFTLDELAIIGVSSSGSAPLSAKFIKFGANDFLTKPFLREEFLCRIVQNMNNLEHVQELIAMSMTDHLTKIYNRKYFFEMGAKYIATARRSKVTSALAILDVDFFKNINDTHGHIAGDAVLVQLGKLLKKYVKRDADIVARFGGEEFCVYLYDVKFGDVEMYFNTLRVVIENLIVEHEGYEIKLTASLGVAVGATSTIHELLDEADRNLYKAKNNGRNLVVMTPL